MKYKKLLNIVENYINSDINAEVANDFCNDFMEEFYNTQDDLEKTTNLCIITNLKPVRCQMQTNENIQN